jgi:hypothetical protein
MTTAVNGAVFAKQNSNNSAMWASRMAGLTSDSDVN